MMIKLDIVVFYPTAMRRVLFSSELGGRMGGWAAAATLSGLDLCDYKLEEVQTWQKCSYHGLVVQRHGQTRVQPLTLTL